MQWKYTQREETRDTGDKNTRGSTRGRIVEAIECTRAKVLVKALVLVRRKTTRAARRWKQREKVSSAWLLACPGQDTRLSNKEFAEAAAANLCLHSPACSARIGEIIKGRVRVEPYGDNLQAQQRQSLVPDLRIAIKSQAVADA